MKEGSRWNATNLTTRDIAARTKILRRWSHDPTGSASSAVHRLALDLDHGRR